jgi:lysophospholipase
MSFFYFLFLPLLVTAQNQGQVTDYAPQTNIECPDITNTDFIREWTPQNQSLHPAEAQYLDNRISTVVNPAWHDWLGDASHLGYNIDQFNNSFPKVGIAIPGGGLRAAQIGAASLNALDARNDTAKAAGTGGMLQVASYIAGLSGTFLHAHHTFYRGAYFLTRFQVARG